MSRAREAASSREILSSPIWWDARQAQYIHPGSVTTGTIPMADATARYMAVPPVSGTYALVNQALVRYNPSVASMEYLDHRPSAVKLYRDDEYYVSIDAVPDTQNGMWMPGGAQEVFLLNPGVKTLAWVSVTNTSPLRMSWLWGR